MMQSKKQELKELEQLASRIAKKKKRIEAQLKEEEETSKWYDQVLKESGYKRPKDFVKALMIHFGIRTVTVGNKSGRGPGRPRKAAAPATSTGRRKRTKITAELRDKVKAILAKGNSMNAVSKQMGISYIVIKKIADGAYDKL
jgi:malate synthase